MAEFNAAFDFVMQHEDASRTGKVTRDAGGRTRFGIAQKFHPDLPEEFFTGPADEALQTAASIYRNDYWLRMRLGELASQPVANKLFDMAVNMGVHQAAMYCQRATNGLLMGRGYSVAVDGVLGNESIKAINACPPSNLYETLQNLSKIHYLEVAKKDPAQAENLKGWMRRAEA